MSRRLLVWLALIVLAVCLMPATSVRAAAEQPDDGVVIWNEDYTVAEDEEVDGDLVIFNGDATVEAGGLVTGDLVVWSGNATVYGTVNGSLVASNGDIELGDEAYVKGDVVCTWNCDIDQQEGARVDGDLIEGPSLRGIPFGQLDERNPWLQMPSFDPEPFWLSGPEQLLRWMFRIARRVVTILVIGAIGGIVALIWPTATDRVGQTVFESPGASVGVGFLTLIAGVALVVALAITICLSPAAALVALALSAAGLFGWIAIGTRLGARILQALDVTEAAPLWTAGLGTLIITLLGVGLTMAFCLAPLGWLLMFVVGCFGLGAVVLTRCGTAAYVPRARQSTDRSQPADPAASSPQPIPEDDLADSGGEEGDEALDHTA